MTTNTIRKASSALVMLQGNSTGTITVWRNVIKACLLNTNTSSSISIATTAAKSAATTTSADQATNTNSQGPPPLPPHQQQVSKSEGGISSPSGNNQKQQQQQQQPLQSSNRNFYAMNAALEKHAKDGLETRPLSLPQMAAFGRHLSREKILLSANYVKQEILVRIARQIQDFQRLPFIVGTNPHINFVYNLYWEAFDTLLSIPTLNSLNANVEFSEKLNNLLQTHLNAVPELAQGLAQQVEMSLLSPQDANHFMDLFTLSRIGRRLLAEHHISLSRKIRESGGGLPSGYNHRHAHHFNHSQLPKPTDTYAPLVDTHLPPTRVSSTQIGIIDTSCRVADVVYQAADVATKAFESAFIRPGSDAEALPAPKVIMDGHLFARAECVPKHLEAVLTELIKNAMCYTYTAAYRSAPEAYKPYGEFSAEALAWQEPSSLLPDPPSTSTTTSRQQQQQTFSFTSNPAVALSPVRVTIAHDPTSSSITFRISDRGGGLSKQEASTVSMWFPPHSPSLRLGIPSSAAIARFWIGAGKGAQVQSLQGLGTDVYILWPAAGALENKWKKVNE